MPVEMYSNLHRLKITGLAFVCVLLFSTADPVLAGRDEPGDREAALRVPWARDISWQEILDRAGAQNSPILIDFTAEWCGPCKLLDAMVFNDGRVIQALSDVIPFQVDFDQPRHTELKERFAVERLPTLVWCDASGREVDRFTGYRAAEDFLATVEIWREGSDTILAAIDRHESQPQNAAFLLDLAERHRLRGEDQRAEVLYRRLGNLSDRFDAATCLTTARGYLGLADIAGRSGRSALGRELALRTTSLLVDCADDRVAGLRQVVECQAALGDTAGMMETWRTLMHLDDHDIVALNGFARAAVQQKRELGEATRVALRAAVLSDLDPRMVDTLAECYYWQGKYRRAIKWIRKSIEKDPDEAQYRRQLTLFEETLELDPYGYRGIRR
jgi:tetratricopeptide (TPR) repeat protein